MKVVKLTSAQLETLALYGSVTSQDGQTTYTLDEDDLLFVPFEVDTSVSSSSQHLVTSAAIFNFVNASLHSVVKRYNYSDGLPNYTAMKTDLDNGCLAVIKYTDGKLYWVGDYDATAITFYPVDFAQTQYYIRIYAAGYSSRSAANDPVLHESQLENSIGSGDTTSTKKVPTRYAIQQELTGYQPKLPTYVQNKYLHVTSNGTLEWATVSVDGKQDTITDLATIRAGAAKGNTSVQPNDNVSRLYNDAGYLTIDDLPTWDGGLT